MSTDPEDAYDASITSTDDDGLDEGEHTPGPWEVDTRFLSIWGRSVGGIQMNEARHRIADVRGWGHLQYRPDGLKVQEANIRLMAASPELLAACEAVSDALLDAPSIWRLPADLMETIEAAIAKAKGGD